MKQSERPDILLISVDTMRRDAMAPYGYDLMPAATRLLEEGVAFDRCMATSSWTSPSFASMFTGLWARQHGCKCNASRRDIPSYPRALWPHLRLLPDMLQNAGYYTVCVQGNNGYLSPEVGFAKGFNQYVAWLGKSRQVNRLEKERQALAYGGVPYYFKYSLQRARWSLTKHRLVERSILESAESLVYKAFRSLKCVPKDMPVFLWINFIDMHNPRSAPGKWTSECKPPGAIRPVHTAPLLYLDDEINEDDKRFIVDRYHGTGRYVDFAISKLLGKWSSLSRKRSRLTMFLSDHGEEFWDHGSDRSDPDPYNCGLLHGHTLYNELLLVPWVISWPEAGLPSRLVTDLVSLIDLTPTLIGLLELDEDTSMMRGRCLAEYLTSVAPTPNLARIVFADSLRWGRERQAAMTSTHKLIRCRETGQSELYAWGSEDPEEKVDISGRTEDAAVLNRLSAALEKWEDSLPPIEYGEAQLSVEDKALAARLAALGYM